MCSKIFEQNNISASQSINCNAAARPSKCGHAVEPQRAAGGYNYAYGQSYQQMLSFRPSQCLAWKSAGQKVEKMAD